MSNGKIYYQSEEAKAKARKFCDMSLQDQARDSGVTLFLKPKVMKLKHKHQFISKDSIVIVMGSRGNYLQGHLLDPDLSNLVEMIKDYKIGNWSFENTELIDCNKAEVSKAIKTWDKLREEALISSI